MATFQEEQMEKKVKRLPVIERPIIFSGGSIPRILAGEKTQTRRVIPSPEFPYREGATLKAETRGGAVVAIPYARGPRMVWNEGPSIR